MASFMFPLIASELSDDEMKKYRDAFALFDKDNNGSITGKELGRVMRELGFQTTESEIQDMIEEVDADGNGTMDFPEFLALLERQMNTPEIEEEAKEAFSVFDKEGNGFISIAELKHVMTHLGEKISEDEVDEMIQAANPENGTIVYDEFIEMMMAALNTGCLSTTTDRK